MEIQKVSPNTKENVKIVVRSAAVGTCLGLVNAVVSGVKATPKDIFQYKELPASQKKIIKASAINGLSFAILIAAEHFFQAKKARKTTNEKTV